MSALIRVMLSSPLAQLQPGERADLLVTVQNLSEIVDRYAITVDGVPPEWVKVSRSEVALFPKDQDQVRITLSPPAGPLARAGAYDVRVQVASRDNPSERTTAALRLEIAAQAILDLQMRPLRQGGTVEGLYTLQVANRGNTDLSVALEAADPEEALEYRFEASQVVLPAGQQRQVALHVRPKPATQARGARVYPFGVTARPAEVPQQARQVQGEWEQTLPSFDLALRPQKGRGTREGHFYLLVSNAGSVPLTLSLEASDPEEGCRFSLQPPQVVVPPEQEARVQLTVYPRTPLPGEQSRTYPFTVTATPASGPRLTRQVQGEWEYLPPTFDLTLRPARESAVGEQAFEVHLSNPQDADIPLRVEVSDLSGAGVFSLYVPEALPVVVPAGTEVQMGLLVRPRSPLVGQVPRPHAFAVRARAVGGEVAPQQIQGEWVQLPVAGPALGTVRPGVVPRPAAPVPLPPHPSGAATRAAGPALEMYLRPPRSSGVQDGYFNLVLSNRGPVDLAVLLRAADAQSACRYSLYAIGTMAVLVPPEREAHFLLVVRPKAPLAAGQASQVHAFTVSAHLIGPTRVTRQVQGEWTQAAVVAPAPRPVPAPAPPARRKRGGGVAVAALVLSLLAFLLTLMAVLWGPVPALMAMLVGLTAFVLGLVGLGSTKRGMAIAGLILGLLAGLLGLLLFVV